MTTRIAPSTPETILILKHVFSAPRQKVFDAWTQPALLKQWFAPSDEFDNPVVDVDLRVGGKYRIIMRHVPKNVQHAAIGEYREIRPPERLVFTWAWEGGNEAKCLLLLSFVKWEHRRKSC